MKPRFMGPLPPVTPVGGQTAGHLFLSGCAEDTTSLAAQNRARHLLGRAGIKWNAETHAMLRAQSPLVGAKRRAAIMRLLQLAADRLAQLVTEHLVTVPSQLPAVVAQACTLVHVEYGQPLRLEALAARLAVSAGHFSRTFHHATGLRFVEYLARYRAERARLLLMEGERPVAEIARACGFCSLSQFNRVFRAVYRTSPRALRRQRSRPVATLPPGYPRGEDLSG
jgi:AraC-like DNA-binding protein